MRLDAWFLHDEDLLDFVEIPAGSFIMGSDPARDRLAFDSELWADGHAPGTRDLPTYYIGCYEVTVDQLREFVEATGYSVGDPQAIQSRPDYPVVWVAWTDALAYGRWLDRSLRESEVTLPRLRQLQGEGWKITLPTEAEWKKAAWGTDGRIFPWGDESRPHWANYGEIQRNPVGAQNCPECPYDLRDLSGNVWEWT